MNHYLSFNSSLYKYQTVSNTFKRNDAIEHRNVYRQTRSHTCRQLHASEKNANENINLKMSKFNEGSDVIKNILFSISCTELIKFFKNDIKKKILYDEKINPTPCRVLKIISLQYY